MTFANRMQDSVGSGNGLVSVAQGSTSLPDPLLTKTS